ncbi:ABC transporter ATP-binding protein [Actinotalea sp. M2MS4P-6]|uniref:ABC transporter ATP-binding protein n=1 Tax=Actinotalea sp. M2MS4P-6 TaxID=2983762 RepID=UPI0021E35C0D|nr:ABC transporter ATP-binding protein [Actinotalea sp. M2MS4P-6]MCV2393599.1 ABC transporter ATP-binding protein [Actinotalea sp. M2MS4P-6]
MATIEMIGVRKEFGATVALADLHLSIGSGELVCLLGPSGCGKTTALRLLAGFETPDAGAILVDGDDITTVPPRRRGFGMVFQEYSLFPNLTARQNIEFGLKVRRAGKAETAATVERLLTMTRLEKHASKFPHQMSGGQKQRVALARAIATQPRLLLLDEPLSALDAQVREHLREEIRRLQQQVGVTTVFVTHDQHEAMAVADRVAVMRDGVLEQIDPPRTLYSRPASAFVAGFVGTVNRVGARPEPDGWRVLGAHVPAVGEAVTGTAVVRPEQLAVQRANGTPGVFATVTGVSFLGALTRLTLDHPDEGPLVADLIGPEADGWEVGDRAIARVRADAGSVVLQ